jgi:Nif-specific regulatory protein
MAMSEVALGDAERQRTENVERFYQCLLAIDCVADPEPVLDTALTLIVEITRSQLAFLELFGDESNWTFWRGDAATSADISIRSKISYGIVHRAVTEGRTIETSSAANDERFSELTSVRQHQIGAVLCAPLGTRLPIGVIYIQGRNAFSTSDRQRVECLAQRLARVAPRLTQHNAGLRRSLADEIRDLQERRILEAMERHDNNITDVARELGVGRAFVYSVLKRLSGV